MTTFPSSKALSFTKYFLHVENANMDNLGAQFEHRMKLVEFWGIMPGSRVLEIGCGQGDCTVVLAEAVGESGHVDAVDPGAPDYGAPYTLAQSQSNILSSPLGPRINFHNADPVAYLHNLSTNRQPYDYVVMAHCIYYFESPSTLPSIITAISQIPNTKGSKLCIAEWSLNASTPASYPHVLAALLLANLEAKRRVSSSGNIRTVFSPAQVKEIISSTSRLGSKWKLEKDKIEKSNEGMLDGHWETSYVSRKRDKFLSTLKEDGVGEKELGVLGATFDALEGSSSHLNGGEKGVKCMDFWTAVWILV